MLTRHVQRAGIVVAAIFAAALFFIGGAALRLLMGPISLGPFASIIEDALNHSVSGVVIRFDQAVLEWSRSDGRVNLIVLGTKVFDLNGHIIAQAPKADLDFEAASILKGHLNLKRFGLLGVQLTGIRTNDGAIRLGFGREQDQANLLDTLREILQNSASGGGSLDSFTIRNARVAFHDEPTGLFIVSPDTTFTLRNRGKAMDAALEASIELSGTPARFSAQIVLRENGMPDHGTLDIKGLSLPSLVKNSTKFAALKAYRLTSDIKADFSLDKGGALTATAFQISGSGDVDTAVLKTPLRLAKFNAAGSYSFAQNHLGLDVVSFQAKEISGQAKLNADFIWKDGALQTLAADVDANNIVLNLSDWFYQPVALSRLNGHTFYDVKARKLSWKELSLQGGPLAAKIDGTMRFADAGAPALTLSGSVDALSIADVLNFWPVDVANGARNWIQTNISDGRLGPVLVKADFPSGALDANSLPNEALDVTFPFEGATAQYITGMTPITGAQGEAKLTGDTFHLSLAAGSIGPVAVSGGDVIIPDLHSTAVTTTIKAHAEGTMTQVLQLIDEPPLGYPKRFGISPASVSGRAAVDLNFALPLIRDLKFDQVRIGVQAKATDLGVPIDNRKLERATASFAIDNKTLTAQGNGNLNNVPVTFKWTEDFEAPDITTRVDLAGKLDDAARANLGLSEPKWLTGTMPSTLALTGRRFHFDNAVLKADLTNAAAEIPQLNVAKRAGTAATGTADLRFGQGGAITVRDFAVTSPRLNVRGALSFAPDGKLLNAYVANLRSGANDVAINIEPTPGGGMNYRFEGKSLDASHYFAEDKKKTTGTAQAKDSDAELQNPVAITAKVDRLLLHDDVALKDVSLTLGLEPQEKLTALALNATGMGKGKITARMTRVNGVRNLALDADDAGVFIATFTNFSSIRNGTLSARITFPGDMPATAGAKGSLPDYQGTFVLSDVTLTDQPFFARLFSAGSLDGPLRLLQGQGIQLTTVSIPFSARGQMVTIREGRASGTAIGATFEGVVDRKAERVDVAGTLVPVYGLNSILGSVPVLGDILVSKKGEGVFGLTYAMKGNLNEPSLAVNPLSVLTPGIFRRIFEFSTPKEPTVQPQALVDPGLKETPAR